MKKGHLSLDDGRELSAGATHTTKGEEEKNRLGRLQDLNFGISQVLKVP